MGWFEPELGEPETLFRSLNFLLIAVAAITGFSVNLPFSKITLAKV